MATNDTHLSTSPLLWNQHQLHILWQLEGYAILLQAANESRWCEILSRKIVYNSTLPHHFCLFLYQIYGHNKIIPHASFFGFPTILALCSLKVQWVLVWFIYKAHLNWVCLKVNTYKGVFTLKVHTY